MMIRLQYVKKILIFIVSGFYWRGKNGSLFPQFCLLGVSKLFFGKGLSSFFGFLTWVEVGFCFCDWLVQTRILQHVAQDFKIFLGTAVLLSSKKGFIAVENLPPVSKLENTVRHDVRVHLVSLVGNGLFMSVNASNAVFCSVII